MQSDFVTESGSQSGFWIMEALNILHYTVLQKVKEEFSCGSALFHCMYVLPCSGREPREKKAAIARS